MAGLLATTSPSSTNAGPPQSSPHTHSLAPRRALPTIARALRRPSIRKPSATINKAITTTTSTPNLRVAYSASASASAVAAAAAADSPRASSTHPPPVPPLPPSLSLRRKLSQAALSSLTSSSLAALPDASESYALSTLNSSLSHATKTNKKENNNNNNNNNNNHHHHSNMAPSPLNPRATASFGADLSVGDTVEVPGNMLGMVRFVGTVQGKKGVFAGVELLPDFAARGKNNGDVDGISYFATSAPGAGIFLPLNKAIKREAGLKAGTQNSTNFNPSTPSTAHFSKSVGPGHASTPLGKTSRPSLGRSESPVRKLQITPGARPSMGAPTARNNTPRFTSPTQTKFSQSVRGPATASDLNTGRSLQPSRNYSVGPRSISALSGQSHGFTTDEDVTPVGHGVARPREGGRVSAMRGPSRQGSGYDDDEIERLRAEVADRDRQLREQQAALTEMENSLVEVQALMEQTDVPAPPLRRGSLDEKDATQLRAIIEDKNKMVARLTAEFDANRADFRSTIDTLELASTETERVYEKKIEELMQDIHAIQERNSDVDAVATQLKQLEELVQELEEGLEDARRGEAEARGEVEFLRGEVERTRAELRREREKAASGANNTHGASNGDQSALFKDFEQKEDEIRGLKAIIHSLSRDSIPGSEGDRPPASAEDTAAREKLEREVAELRALLDTKNTHEEQLERELADLRRGSVSTLRSGADRSSIRDSRDTVVAAREADSSRPSSQHKAYSRVRAMDTMPDSDTMSSITENSGLWCELCETSGHDILVCTNMFGGSQKGGDAGPAPVSEDALHKTRPLSPRLPLPPPPPPPAPAPAPAPVSKPAPFKAPPPNMLDPGPVAGKESGIIDAEAWCALCEKDGHNSVDCPFEDAF
ncbi:unnamed protein product [Discula destructiva]